MRPRYFAEESTEDIAFIGGEWRRDVHWTITDDIRDRLAQGYMCLNCLEPFTSPYPDECTMPGCGYEPAKYQKQDFDRKYRGRDNDLWRDDT